MSLIQITDNQNIDYGLKDIDDDLKEKIKKEIKVVYSDKNLETLNKDNNFIMYPSSHDKDTNIFEHRNGQLWSSNLVGFINIRTEVDAGLQQDNYLEINTRFYDSGDSEEDYLLHYLILRKLKYNVIQDKLPTEHMPYYQLLMILFPDLLNKAMKKGIYKEYIKRQYNDTNIKGIIDVARHIKSNTPFIGKIAYNTREFSFDNNITELIRHTYEKIKNFINHIEKPDKIFQENIKNIIEVTPKYNKMERSKVLRNNINKPLKHGYYHEYLELQKICILILMDEKISFGTCDQLNINGILIDVSWLWEDFLAGLLVEKGFKHPDNKNRSDGISLFSNRKRTVYPDFYKESSNGKEAIVADIVLDAKYKKLQSYTNTDSKKINRDDLYQMISYLHVLNAEKAGVIFPIKPKEEINDSIDGVEDDKNNVSEIETSMLNIGSLNGYGGDIYKIGFVIPQNEKTFEAFEKSMNESIEVFNENIDKLIDELCKKETI